MGTRRSFFLLKKAVGINAHEDDPKLEKRTAKNFRSDLLECLKSLFTLFNPKSPVGCGKIVCTQTPDKRGIYKI
jgi:hypothetical protein